MTRRESVERHCWKTYVSRMRTLCDLPAASDDATSQRALVANAKEDFARAWHALEAA